MKAKKKSGCKSLAKDIMTDRIGISQNRSVILQNITREHKSGDDASKTPSFKKSNISEEILRMLKVAPKTVDVRI